MARRSFAADAGGAVGVVAALTMPLLIGFSALGVDYGYFLYDRQQLQHAVDLAALSAAAAAGREEETARRLVAENADADAEVEVVLGTVTDGGDGQGTFREGLRGGAVQVRAKRPTTLFLSKLFLKAPPVLDVSAIASVRPTVSFAVGSKLASVSGGIPAALTQAFLGSRIDLSVLGHDGLVRSSLQASGLAAALAAATGTVSGTIGQLLDREIGVRLLVQSVAQVLRAEGKPTQAVEVERLGYELARADATVRLGDLLDLPRNVREVTVGTPARYLDAKVSVSSLLTAALSPRRSGSALSTGLSVPGLLSSEVDLLVGEPMVRHPSLAIAESGVSLETSQIRSRVRVRTGLLLGALSTRLDIPLDLAIAAGTAKVTRTVCDVDLDRRSVTVEVRPGAVRLELGEGPARIEEIGLDPHGRSAELLRLPLLSVRAHALAAVRSASATSVTFTGREIGNGTVRQVGSTRMVSALVDDLLRSLRIEVRVLGLGLGLGDGAVSGLVRTALLALSGPIDTVLDGVLAALGIRIGAIDVRVDDLACGQSRIVG